MKYNAQKCSQEIYDKTEQSTKMSRELFEHLEDIRVNWRDGNFDRVEKLIQEWESNEA